MPKHVDLWVAADLLSAELTRNDDVLQGRRAEAMATKDQLQSNSNNFIFTFSFNRSGDL